MSSETTALGIMVPSGRKGKFLIFSVSSQLTWLGRLWSVGADQSVVDSTISFYSYSLHLSEAVTWLGKKDNT